jgi:hypothetical protein
MDCQCSISNKGVLQIDIGQFLANLLYSGGTNAMSSWKIPEPAMEVSFSRGNSTNVITPMS